MELSREEAIRRIKAEIPCENYLVKAKHAGYVCLYCGNGTGKDATGSVKIYKGNTWSCHVCEKENGKKSGGDVIDLHMKKNGVDYNQAIKEMAASLGIEIAKPKGAPHPLPPKKEDQKPAAVDQKKSEPAPAADQITEPPKEANQTAFFLTAAADIEKTDYHRGISLETLQRYKVGYVEAWKPPTVPKAPASPRLIIPISPYTYIARRTDGREEYQKQKTKTWETVPAEYWIFNRKSITKATKPIVVVEGEIDALSIIDAGGEAVGLGSISNVGTFLNYVKEHKPAQPLVLSLDNDKNEDGSNPGQEAEQRLANGLEALGIPFYRHNIAGDHKDANEALQADRDAFTKEVEAVAAIPAKEYRNQTAAAGFMQAFIDGIADSVNTPPISTGFSQLDSELDGGLYEGLYTIGAISSLGKTALVMQMVDQMAAAGHDVLVISLEMARTELMARSISRQTFIDCIATGEDQSNAKTVRGITDFSRWSRYSRTEKELIEQSMKHYETYADHVFIVEGIGNIGVEQIREAVQRHTSIMGKPPIVVVDYLQLLAPAEVRASDKQNTDKAVLELKRISRDYKTPVIAISSFNRMNYSSPAAMEAFKESGAIEYSSDVLFGLQLEGVGNKDFDLEKAKRESPRKIELVILKNRNGRTGGKVPFDYYAMFNYYNQGGALEWDSVLSGLDYKKE